MNKLISKISHMCASGIKDIFMSVISQMNDLNRQTLLHSEGTDLQNDNHHQTLFLTFYFLEIFLDRLPIIHRQTHRFLEAIIVSRSSKCDC